MKNLNINSIEYKGTKLLPEQLDKVIGGGGGSSKEGGNNKPTVSTFSDGRGKVGAEVKVNEKITVYGATDPIEPIFKKTPPEFEFGVAYKFGPTKSKPNKPKGED